MKSFLIGFFTFGCVVGLIFYSSEAVDGFSGESWLLTFLLLAVLIVTACLCARWRQPTSPADIGSGRPGEFEPDLDLPVRTLTRVSKLGDRDMFDENRIHKELQELADNSNRFSQRRDVQRKQRLRAKEVEILSQWKGFYDAGSELIKSKTEMLRARNEYRGLQCENEEKSAAKEANIARHQADIEEQNLRKEKAVYQRQHLERFVDGGTSANERKLNEAFERRQMDNRWELHGSLSQLHTLIELQHWRRQQRERILADRTLSSQEQSEDVQFVDDLYAQKRAELKTDTRIFEED